MAIQLKRRETPEYLNEIKLDNLIDHILSGELNRFFLYTPLGSEQYDSAVEAVSAFNLSNDKGNTRLLIATRQGTGVILLNKDIK
jgi:hypothetical protein